MELKKGMVVRARAGKETGQWFVITEIDGNTALIANGKRRKLEKPKRKNVKHLSATRTFLEIEGLTDKKLRAELKAFGGEKPEKTDSDQNVGEAKS